MALTNLSYDRKLASDMSMNALFLNAMHAILVLMDHCSNDPSQCNEIKFCVAAIGWNLSYSRMICEHLIQKTAVDAEPVRDLLTILKSNFHPQAALSTLQLTCGAMVNYSRQPEFWEVLVLEILGDAVGLLLATRTHLHVKLVSENHCDP